MYKYYIIRNIGDKKEVYGVVKETQKYITVEIIKSKSSSKSKNKKMVLDKATITKNIGQFDFTTSIEQ